ANGVPVVLPSHGAFPEMLAQARGGILFEPGSPESLADGLSAILNNRKDRCQLAQNGHRQVRTFFSTEVMARESMSVFTEYLDSSPGKRHDLGAGSDPA
ncbi:MAG: glycosyltransferase, partial [Planctomycetaceae bacterium]